MFPLAVVLFLLAVSQVSAQSTAEFNFASNAVVLSGDVTKVPIPWAYNSTQTITVVYTDAGTVNTVTPSAAVTLTLVSVQGTVVSETGLLLNRNVALTAGGNQTVTPFTVPSSLTCNQPYIVRLEVPYTTLTPLRIYSPYLYVPCATSTSTITTATSTSTPTPTNDPSPRPISAGQKSHSTLAYFVFVVIAALLLQ